MRYFLPAVLLLGIFFSCNNTRETPPERLSWTFPTEGISKVRLRAARAAGAVIRTKPQAEITISARPALAASSYHAPDPTGRETPAEKWSFDLVASREGRTLILATKGETAFRQHRYFLTDWEIVTPPGVEVVREPRAPAKATP